MSEVSPVIIFLSFLLSFYISTSLSISSIFLPFSYINIVYSRVPWRKEVRPPRGRAIHLMRLYWSGVPRPSTTSVGKHARCTPDSLQRHPCPCALGLRRSRSAPPHLDRLRGDEARPDGGKHCQSKVGIILPTTSLTPRMSGAPCESAPDWRAFKHCPLGLLVGGSQPYRRQSFYSSLRVSPLMVGVTRDKRLHRGLAQWVSAGVGGLGESK